MPRIVLPIETSIEARVKELGLSQGELTERIGQKKPPWIWQRLEQLYSGKFGGEADFLARLSAAIELPLLQIEAAIAQSRVALVEADRQRREALKRKEQAAHASYLAIVAGTSIRIPAATLPLIGTAQLTAPCYLLRRRSFLQGLSIAAAAAALPAPVLANSIAPVRLRKLKIGSPQYEAGFRVYKESNRPPDGFRSMSHFMGWVHGQRKAFNELHRDILTPADPPPGFAHGNFRW